MTTRREIIFEALKDQYPQIDDSAHQAVAENIDTHWHILKNKSLHGENGEWTLSGHIQSYIWETYGGGAQSATAAHKILSKLTQERMK